MLYNGCLYIYSKKITQSQKCGFFICLFYHFRAPGLLHTTVNGKLILAKYVHSENEKEEEEHVFSWVVTYGEVRRVEVPWQK